MRVQLPVAPTTATAATRTFGLRPCFVHYQVPAPDRHDTSYYDLRFGSSHTGLLNAVFADGSVRPIHYSVPLTVFQRACARDDAQAFNLDDL